MVALRRIRLYTHRHQWRRGQMGTQDEQLASCLKCFTWPSDRPAALRVKLFGQRLRVWFSKSAVYFGLGNRLVSSPQKNQGLQRIAGDVRWKLEKLSFEKFYTLLHFLYFITSATEYYENSVKWRRSTFQRIVINSIHYITYNLYQLG